jgi:hypothetical protein
LRQTVAHLPVELLTPEEEELARKQASLAELEAQLADRELDLATCRADLGHFEKHYLQTVGRRYVLLDELRAKIAEARARQQPQSQEARERADQARGQARESARAADEDSSAEPPTGDAASAAQPNRSESLNKLYRQAARLMHPDLTLDGDEKLRRHHLMAEVNAAFARGDEERIRTILRDWHASPENVRGDGPGAELVRVIRKIAQVEKRLKAIAAEMEQIREGELFRLRRSVEEAKAERRDLLQELVERLERDIGEARDELTRVTKAGGP